MMDKCEYRISLPVHDWPVADRRAWEDACRPGSRLKPRVAPQAVSPTRAATTLR